MTPAILTLEVWGELACFTRPELKVERLSYPLITPSAARGILDAIHCKPDRFRWQITAIDLLAPPRFIALRRNETKGKAPGDRTLLRWASGAEPPQPIWADDMQSEASGRTQRQTVALRDVRYRIHAQVRPWDGAPETIAKHQATFRRHARAGQCVYQPCFGCREFPAYFKLIEAEEAPPLLIDLDVGWMLYDVFDLSRPGTSRSAPAISLFRARVERGRLTVPPFESDLVRKPGGRRN